MGLQQVLQEQIDAGQGPGLSTQEFNDRMFLQTVVTRRLSIASADFFVIAANRISYMYFHSKKDTLPLHWHHFSWLRLFQIEKFLLKEGQAELYRYEPQLVCYLCSSLGEVLELRLVCTIAPRLLQIDLNSLDKRLFFTTLCLDCTIAARLQLIAKYSFGVCLFARAKTSLQASKLRQFETVSHRPTNRVKVKSYQPS